MANLEKLKGLREKQAMKLAGVSEKIAEKREKQMVKQDIRRIKSARLRGQFGISHEGVKKVGKIFKGTGKAAGKGLLGLGKVALAIGQGANEYYAQGKKKRK